MLCYHKFTSGCQNNVLKFPFDQNISLGIINEEHGYAASEIHGRGNLLNFNLEM